ncbi:unnamed protein product [Effrenium voratum]|nr:unnamed protein product [Effrenium voratum]
MRLALLFLGLAGASASLVATGNPHIPAETCDSKDGGDCECPAQRLELSQILQLQPPVQADSLMSLERHKVAGLEVTLYNFRQPRRLSHLELPFKLLLLRALDLTDLEVLEVSPEQARDSWFVGYEWSIVICRRGSGRHLGWKFTPRGHTNEAPFYALIVAASEVEEGLEQKLLAGLQAVGQPLAALGLAATLEL